MRVASRHRGDGVWAPRDVDRRDTPSTRQEPTTQADAWDGWLDDADAVVFAGTSFPSKSRARLSGRCRDRRVPIYNFNVDEPEKTVALANAARLRRATALQTCDESFPQLEKAVRSKLRARGLEKPPSLPPPPPPGFLLDDASESSSEAPSSTDDRIILTHYAVPDGFRAVKDSELEDRRRCSARAPVERGDLYLIICCDDGDWMMGRIAKHKPNAKRFQYDVAWSETSRVCQQGLRLEDLFDPDGDVALPGVWRYLRKVSERASPNGVATYAQSVAEEPGGLQQAGRDDRDARRSDRDGHREAGSRVVVRGARRRCERRRRGF